MKKATKKNIEEGLRLQKELSNPDLTKHLYTDENGDFKSSFKLKRGTINLAYVEQMILWAYTHPDLTKKEKLEKILLAEELERQLCASMGLNYIPHYSKLLKARKSKKSTK